MRLAHTGAAAPRGLDGTLRRGNVRAPPRGALVVVARCSGAVGKSASGIGRDLKPSESGADRSSWTLSAEAVPPAAPAAAVVASHEQNRYFLPAALAAAAISIGFNIWRFVGDRQQQQGEKETAPSVPGLETAPFALQSRKIVVSEEWSGTAPVAEFAPAAPIPRSLRDVEPLLPNVLDPSEIASVSDRLLYLRDSDAPRWALPPAVNAAVADLTGVAPPESADEDDAVARAVEAAYRSALESGRITEEAEAAAAVSASPPSTSEPAAPVDVAEPEEGSRASYLSESSDAAPASVSATSAPVESAPEPAPEPEPTPEPVVDTAPLFSFTPVSAATSLFIATELKPDVDLEPMFAYPDDDHDEEMSSMFDAAAARLSQMTFDEPSTESRVSPAAADDDADASVAGAGASAAASEASSAEDLQDSFRARLRASAQRAAQELEGSSPEATVSESFLRSDGGSLLGPDTIFQPQGGVEAIEAKWQGLAAEILQSVREKTRAGTAGTGAGAPAIAAAAGSREGGEDDAPRDGSS